MEASHHHSETSKSRIITFLLSYLISKKANLWKRCHVRVWNLHLSKNATVNGHGSFVNLICTVTFVSQVLPRLLREAIWWDAWDWHPPLLLLALNNNSAKWARTSWIRWHASLFCIPKFSILETIQYFLSSKIQVIMNIWHWNENRVCSNSLQKKASHTMSIASSFVNAGRLM